jgi:hypothetical protein
MSRFFHQDQTIEVWRNASTHRIVEKGQQGPIQHVETQVSSIHVVDGIPVRVEKSSLYTRTESTCSQSIGYLSPIDTPATELSEWWPPNSGVLAFVGGQSEEPALSQPSLANDRSSATAAVDSEDKENAKDCPIIKITGVGDADSSELIGEKNRGGDISQKAFGQVDPDAPLLWDMSKAHLDWVKPKDLLTSISLGIQRAGTFPCVGKFHFEEDLVSAAILWLLRVVADRSARLTVSLAPTRVPDTPIEFLLFTRGAAWAFRTSELASVAQGISHGKEFSGTYGRGLRRRSYVV